MIIRSTALKQLFRCSVLCLFVNLYFAVTSQAANAADQLTVREFAGAVKLKMDDRWQDPEVDMVVDLPATVSTGEDGSIELVQDGTVYSVAANTALELLAGTEPGQLVRRVVQSKGSAFYDVSKREQQKLRVETPYLVAVIKGTQFNVTVERKSASISLFEGLLQIEAPDIDEIIDLQAGFIARRNKGDASITVIPMDNGEPNSGKSAAPVPSSGAPGSSDTGGTADGGLDVDGGFVADNADDVASLADAIPVADGIDMDGELNADTSLDVSDTELGSTVGFDSEAGVISLEAESGAEFDSGGLGADLSADADIGDDIGLDLDADADLGGGDIGADLGADADVGDIGADLDAAVDADLGTGDLGADLGVDATVGDDVGLGLDAGADADLGSGDIGADLGTDAEVGDIGADLDAGVDADLGTGDLGADASLGDAGLDASLSDGGLDVDADLGALDDSLDLTDDLLGAEDTDSGTTEEEEEEEEIVPLPDLGDLLGL